MEKENKKDSIKVIIVTLTIIVLLAVIIISTMTIIKKFKNDKPLPDWGEKYYDYLKEFKTSKKTKTLLAENKVEMQSEYRGEFYTYDKDQAPAMILSYDPPRQGVSPAPSDPGVVEPEPGEPSVDPEPVDPEPIEPAPVVSKNYIVILLLINGEIKEFIFEADSVRIELLYNIAEKEYYYYLMYQEDDATHFIKINDYIKSLTDDDFEYEEIVIKNGETVEVDGEVVLKIDITFYEPENVKGIYFKFDPSKTDGLEASMGTYYDNMDDTYKKLIDDKKNGLENYIDNYFYIIIEIYGEDWSDKPVEPAPEPGKVEPEPEPEPEPAPAPACEYDYMTYLPSYGKCVDVGQLVTPGGCDYGYYEQNGVCFSFECDGLPETGIDPNCADQYPVPGPNECPPNNTLYDGYCIRN